MKTNHPLFHRFRLHLGFVVLALALAGASPLFADDATNLPAAVAASVLPITPVEPDTNAVRTSDSSQQNTFGLPKEAFDRLSPNQIMTLAQSRQNSGPNYKEMIGASSAVLVPLAFFAMVIVLVTLGISQKLKRNRMMHDTIRLMIEKGQPIPPELLQPQEARKQPVSDLRRGLVFIAIGIGLCLLLFNMHDVPRGVAAVGAIPLLMGVAFLITWKIESKSNGHSK